MSTATATDTTSRIYHAVRVARRVKGDLQALDRLYGCTTQSEIEALENDLMLGMALDCLGSFTFYLRDKWTGSVKAAYQYSVDDGSFEPSSHSGRFVFDEALKGAELSVTVWPSKRTDWENLKARGKLKISWTPSAGYALSHLTAASDGGYSSGLVGVSRTTYN